MILTEGGARRGFELLDDLGLLEAVLPEVARMKGVEQPPQFHPEGDVWTHTQMVVDELIRLEDWASLDRRSQLALLFVALFHDDASLITCVGIDCVGASVH